MIKVLLIEDNPGDARRIRELLLEGAGASIALARADRLSSGLHHLETHGVDLILLDLTLPDSAGFDTFAKVQAKAGNLPVILLTGLADEEVVLRTAQEGARDYILKDSLTANSLECAIRFAIERHRSTASVN